MARTIIDTMDAFKTKADREAEKKAVRNAVHQKAKAQQKKLKNKNENLEKKRGFNDLSAEFMCNYVDTKATETQREAFYEVATTKSLYETKIHFRDTFKEIVNQPKPTVKATDLFKARAEANKKAKVNKSK